MTSNYKDSTLIADIKAGNQRSYSIFIDKYKNLVYSLALKMLDNREEAEEIAQDSFIKAFKSIHKFKGDSKLSTWVYKIVYNSCLDRIKSNKNKLYTLKIDDCISISDSNAISAIDIMQRDELKKSVEACFKYLSSEDSFLLTLFYFEEQSLEEIAKVLDIKPNNVKVKLFRARKKLNTIFKSQLEPEILMKYDRAQ